MPFMALSPPDRPSRWNIRFVIPSALPVEVSRTDLTSGAVRAMKVVVLQAPAGYGKSTVLAQAARLAEHPVWLRLNEEARDARSLLEDLARACKEAHVPLVTWDRVYLADAPREQLLNALTDDLNAHEDDLSFFVDGGEYLSTESALLLSTFASLLGEGHQLLVAQREGSAFSSAPAIARGEGLVIGEGELRFTEAHTMIAAAQLGHSTHSADLQQDFQGWPWGIMLSLHSRQTGRELAGAELARSVLSSLPDALREALPALSVLEFWSLDAAAALGVTLPDGWFGTLHRAGLPLTAMGQSRYVPHDVLREVLTEQLRAAPDRWAHMHARAADLAEAAGEPYSAIRHHVAAGQVEPAVRLIEQLIPRWYRAADWRLAEEALRLLPPSALNAELRSTYALAVLETGDVIRGRELLEAQLAAQPTVTAHFAMTLVALRTSDYPAMLQHAEAGLAIATQQRDIIQLLRAKAVYLVLVKRSGEAIAAAQEAVERADAYGDASLRLATLGVLAYAYRNDNQIARALAENERLYQVGTQLGLVHRLMPVVDQLGSLYADAGRLTEAAHLLESYLVACERSYPLGTPSIKHRLGQVYALMGRVEDAEAMDWASFQWQVDKGDHLRLISTLYNLFFRGVTGPQRAQVIAAFDLARTLMGEDKDKHGPGTWANIQEMHAFAAYTSGDFDGALARLDAAAEVTLQTEQVTYVLTELLRGHIHWERGSLTPDHALGLQRALESQPHDIRDLKLVPGLAGPLLREYIRRGWHTGFFQNVVQKIEPVASAPARPIPLALTTFGALRGEVDGQPVKLGHSSALEALVYVLLHPEARQDEVADQVWSHGDLKRARQSAQVARSTLNAAFRAAVAHAAPTFGDLVTTSGASRKNPQWTINAHVEVALDVQAYLRSRDPDMMLRTHPASFLDGSENEWADHYREVLTRHAVQVLDGATLGAAPEQTLAYLVRAADLTQDRERYEKVRRAAHQAGQDALSHAAEQALRGLERGDTASLGAQWTLN